ncbi:MAG: hypothetical protein ACK401_07775 [Archaeoglobaceae archaeon]
MNDGNSWTRYGIAGLSLIPTVLEEIKKWLKKRKVKEEAFSASSL